MNLLTQSPAQTHNTKEIKKLYRKVREQTERLCAPLETEDYVPQPVSEVSPPKWHLAHTTWFFENFILKQYQPEYVCRHPQYNFLFNSYYQHAGKRWQREHRGALSRPTVQEIYDYRQAVDEAVLKFVEEADPRLLRRVQPVLELGLNHEQQHQELLLYDIKYILGSNPLFPVYNTARPARKHFNGTPADYDRFMVCDEGFFEVGHSGYGFAYDNEMPVQKVYVPVFQVRKGLVTNEEYLEFVRKGGYDNFRYWLDDGWKWLNANEIKAPLYWHLIEGEWMEMTLNGLQPLNPTAPVTHISFYEANAFAGFRGNRLPSEFEWEIAARISQPDPAEGNFLEDGLLHPMPVHNGASLYQALGDVWEWTNSSYLPYRGYQAEHGALGEYNGKFMVNQMVLRGGSCATPRDHIRLTYRNFFYPEQRWLFSGIRLAN